MKHDDWFTTKIGEQMTLQRGFDITKLTQRPGTVPVVSTAGVLSFHDTHMANAPGVIVGRKGNGIGRTQYIEQDYWPHDTTLWVKDFKGNDPRFVFYFLSQMLPLLQSMDVGSANPTLNRNHIHPIEISWPPLLHQVAIARTLGSLDDKIDLNRRMGTTLEEVARAIFKAWFVDFEPVRAKADGGRLFPGMPQAVFDALPDRLGDSPLGPIPEGWSVRPLGELIEVNPSRRLAKGSLAPYLDMGQMPTTGHAPDDWIQREAGSGARFMNGDTLVARITPCLENGKTAFVDFLADGQVAWGSTEYIVLRTKPPMPEIWAYLLARSSDFRAHAIQSMSGTSGRQRVPAEAVANYPLVSAPADALRAFGAIVDPLFARSSAGVRESRKLAEVRDYLLPKLLSGRVRVKDAERVVAEADS